jgi:hypothetical protein
VNRFACRWNRLTREPYKFDLAPVQIDPAPEQIDSVADKSDPNGVQIGSSLEQLDPAAVQIDPEAERSDPEAVQLDPRSEQIDSPSEQIDASAEQVRSRTRDADSKREFAKTNCAASRPLVRGPRQVTLSSEREGRCRPSLGAPPSILARLKITTGRLEFPSDAPVANRNRQLLYSLALARNGAPLRRIRGRTRPSLPAVTAHLNVAHLARVRQKIIIRS